MRRSNERNRHRLEQFTLAVAPDCSKKEMQKIYRTIDEFLYSQFSICFNVSERYVSTALGHGGDLDFYERVPFVTDPNVLMAI